MSTKLGGKRAGSLGWVLVLMCVTQWGCTTWQPKWLARSATPSAYQVKSREIQHARGVANESEEHARWYERLRPQATDIEKNLGY